jgi:3-oxoacid CoA-transferase subunit A
MSLTQGGSAMTSKVWPSAQAAVRDIGSGAKLAVGGFGLCGIPDQLIAAIAETGATDFEIFSNNCGAAGEGLELLLSGGRIRRIVASYVGDNAEFARQYISGELEVELTPQGTLAERLRAGGAGIPAFYTPAGVGTVVSDGGMPWRYHPDGTVAIESPPKETRVFDGRRYVLEESINADFGLVHAKFGDTDGNLIFAKSAMNFNPLAAMASTVAIAQVEVLLQPGEIEPAAVHLPGIFVQRVVHTGPQHKHVERHTVRSAEGATR